MKSHRIPELDGIRGVAILLVLLWHYVACQVGLSKDPVLYYTFRVLSLTWSGVDLFFVLSGFLLGGILLDNRDSSNYFRVFYFRRVCRILPLYYAWLLSYLVIAAVWTDREQRWTSWLLDDPMPLWSYVFFLQNLFMAEAGGFGANWLTVTWSLAIEEQFYLVLPVLIYVVPRRQLRWVLPALILSAPLLRTLLVENGYRGFTAYLLMPGRADALLLGTLAALIVRDTATRDLLARRVGVLYGLASVLLLGILVTLRESSRNPAVVSSTLATYGLSLIALFYACLLLIAVTERRGPVTFVVRSRALGSLGLIAYGVYMIHLPMGALFHGWLRGALPRMSSWNDAQVTATALIVTLVLARLSWTWFEKPILSVGQRYHYQPRQSAQVVEVQHAGPG